MRRFVTYLLIILLGLFIVDTCFGIIMKSTLKSTIKGDWGRRNYIINASNEELLIFGASRAIHHYDTKILSDSLKMSCYNCGDDGMGILVHTTRFKRIIQRYHPKVVVYEIAPEIDYFIRDNSFCLKTLRPYSNDIFVKDVICNIDKKELLKLHLNLYKFNSSFIDIFVQRFSHVPITAMDYTYSPLLSVMNYEPGPAIFESKGIDPVKYKYLSEFVDLCCSNGVKLIFTASPWYRMSKSNVFAPIYKLCREKGAIFLNHNFDNNFNLEKNYFHDALHLNQLGAETYTSLIAHEIKENL